MRMQTVVWIIAVSLELLFCFRLFYGVFYGRRLSGSNVIGLVLGIILMAMVLGALGAPAGAANL